MAPPPVALMPSPLVVSMSRPPLVKRMAAPVLLLKVTAVLAPVFKTLLLPLKLTVPPLLSAT